MSQPGGAAGSPRVFVSYARESEEHKRLVIEFATLLRVDAGIDARVDVWEADSRRDWVAWACEQFKHADLILVIASPAYGRTAGGGRTELEQRLLNDNLARNLSAATRRILPVVLPGRSVDEIPDVLCGHATDRYVISELNLDGLADLLRAVHGSPAHVMPPLGPLLPPVPGADPVMVARSPAPVEPGSLLRPGTETEVGQHRYLVHDEGFREQATPDGAAARREARALRIGPPHELVWLRQVEVRQETAAARAAADALVREHDLLSAPTGRGPGMPELLGLDTEQHTTLVTRWPESSRTGGPCDTLATFLPEDNEVVDPLRTGRLFRAIAGLCGVVATMHDHGRPHRWLEPECMIRLDDGSLVLRDLGLAATEYRRGEGPSRYRAPEQGRRAPGGVGPWTDVYQIAAVAYHLATGNPPALWTPVPVGGRTTTLPSAVSRVIDAALTTDPARRPDIRTFAAALEWSPGQR
ncbi:SEFIR domain-containing protein [Amycolatopsis suaedae]|uniref:SEFIR domain-containing protein n=1 Tax=Amycolatopsis suaedae TaxID=2510978 RepID=UPI0013EEEFA2|nr:SEFIR domain-containing protein [Amycolatopsis suaedae]